MNVEDVHHAVARAAERARAGEGPTFLEFKTYRYKGHSMSDPAKYRSKEEVEEYRHRDSIEAVRHTILSNGMATEEQLDAIDEQIKTRGAGSRGFCRKLALPRRRRAVPRRVRAERLPVYSRLITLNSGSCPAGRAAFLGLASVFNERLSYLPPCLRFPLTGKSPGARQPVRPVSTDPLAPAQESYVSENPLLEDPGCAGRPPGRIRRLRAPQPQPAAGYSGSGGGSGGRRVRL